MRRSDGYSTLNPTALVNETWLKLANSPGLHVESQLHFKRIAARAMRQILTEAARRRMAQKRGGADSIVVTLGDLSDDVCSCDEEMLSLDAALEHLAQLSPRQAMIIESRFFGGLDIGETAALLNVSEATVVRDWRAAKAWLANEISRRSARTPLSDARHG